MSDKYCPVGKINCEMYEENIQEGKMCNVLLKLKPIFSSVQFWETCPFPSKKKPIFDKHEKAWQLFWNKIMSTEVKEKGKEIWMHKDFISSLEEAGL
jgi:hypothetical protein